MTAWQDWIGRSAAQSDIVTPSLVRRHRATLDLAPDNSHPLPGIHWLLNLPDAKTAELGEDGHPRRDIANSFLPPIDLPRRMWASSEIEFLTPISVGATVTRTSTIVDIVEKNGASGRLAFVTLDHATEADGVAALREKQTLVYREESLRPALDRGTPAPQHNAGGCPGVGRNDAAVEWPHHRTIYPSESLLFRFSALTFNTHRIHYDLPYARDAEGYAGLVVHGPLTATLLLNWAVELFGTIRHFSFRAVAPAFAGDELTLVARQDGDSISLAALGPSGTECVKASASL